MISDVTIDGGFIDQLGRWKDSICMGRRSRQRYQDNGLHLVVCSISSPYIFAFSEYHLVLPQTFMPVSILPNGKFSLIVTTALFFPP